MSEQDKFKEWLSEYSKHDIFFTETERRLMFGAWQAAKVNDVLQWISVEDELPKHNDEVICANLYHGKCYGLAYSYCKGGYWFLDKDSIDVFGDASVDLGFNPTHWMPLPEPPTKEKDND